MRYFTTFCVLLGSAFAACTGPSPTWTCPLDANGASVRNLLNGTQAGLQRGDAINVGSGSATLTSPWIITKGATLAGAGIGSTVIINGLGDGTVLQISPDATAIANEETIKVTGFTIDGNGDGYGLIGTYGAPDNGTKPFKHLIIVGNRIQNTGSTSGHGNTCIYNFSGQTRGLISGNTFDRCDIVYRPMGSDDTTEWSNTAYNNFSYGSVDNLYFENNSIIYSVPYHSDDNYGGWIESGQGGRTVVRFNTWDMSNITNSAELWDIHGFQNFYGGPDGQTGTMIVEYYKNTVIHESASNYRWIDHRGSWGMFFNNTYSGGSSPDIEVNQYDGGCTNQIVPAPSNYNPIVNNSYFFNNTVNGSLSPAISGSVNSCGVVENTNWWNQNNSFNGTVGVGYGVLSGRPSTCTTGVGYWATDQGSWNTSGSGGQGVFYKCTSTNTWTLYYTPYTYPHPLLGGGTYTITISSVVRNGTVTSSDAVINCGKGLTGTCTDSAATGTITLTATPDAGFSFTSWGGGTCAGASMTCAVTGTATVTATFTATPTFPAPASPMFSENRGFQWIN